MAGVKKVLITGVTGLIGGVILADLRRDHEVTGIARRYKEGIRHFQGDIFDYEGMLPAFEGQDAVVHLAANASVATPWESARARRNKTAACARTTEPGRGRCSGPRRAHPARTAPTRRLS